MCSSDLQKQLPSHLYPPTHYPPCTADPLPLLRPLQVASVRVLMAVVGVGSALSLLVFVVESWQRKGKGLPGDAPFLFLIHGLHGDIQIL